MRLVILESPYSSNNGHPIAKNIAYAKACIIDCLERNESPIASHLLFTLPDLLDDNEPWERMLGIQAGHAWYRVAEACVLYKDLGISSGMKAGMKAAFASDLPVEIRSIKFNWKERTNGQEPLCNPAPAEELCGQGAYSEARQTDPGDESEAFPGRNKAAEKSARVLTAEYLGRGRGFGKFTTGDPFSDFGSF